MITLLAFVLPLGLDSFAVSAALGAQRPRWTQRLRLTALFVLFEAGMPLVGLAVGAPLARVLGTAADYLAAAALIAVGVWMLVPDGDGEEQAAGRMLTARGWAMVGLGLGISLDELTIGFTLGLSGLPVATVIVAIAVQAFVFVQLGLALGSWLGERWREAAERLAGAVLIMLGVGVLLARLVN